ncbi:Glucose-6-phosphate isomerase [Candidatus Anstonella stagnisolia]|nr:Glucose-6-phosphate isomerase [Candidatus Anstonella stagnisolia]
MATKNIAPGTLPEGFSIKNDSLFKGKEEAPHDARTVSRMQKVLHAKSDLPSETVTYKMYRGIWQKGTMRFDVTILPPMLLGDEPNKTFGHYHPSGKDGIPFPEIYEVLSGEAHFLLQTHDPKNISQTERAILVSAKKGDIVLMQPYFGHLTINSGKAPLALANLVFANFSSDYSAYEKLHGGAFYELAGGSLVPNAHYLTCPLEKTSAADFAKAFGHPKFSHSLYELAQKDISQFAFLENPLLLLKKY